VITSFFENPVNHKIRRIPTFICPYDWPFPGFVIEGYFEPETSLNNRMQIERSPSNLAVFNNFRTILNAQIRMKAMAIKE